MGSDKRPDPRRINDILTVAAALFLMFWAWKWFGPDRAVHSAAGEASLFTAGLSFSGLAWTGVAVVCGGYLLWRLLTCLFWRKYFNDEKPPEEPDEWK